MIPLSALGSDRLETALTVSDVTTVLLERGLANNQLQARGDANCMFYFRTISTTTVPLAVFPWFAVYT
jgi:hypothetical protein